MDMAMSISHDPDSNLTCGLLLTRSDEQTAFVTKELERYKAIATYPLLLPLLFSDYQRQLLNEEGERLWFELLKMETQTGQTGVPVMFMDVDLQRTNNDFDEMIKGVLHIVQLAAGWITYTESLLLVIEAIQVSLEYIHNTTPHSRQDHIEATESVLVEYLGFVHQRCKIMLSELQYIYKRGQAQMTAVSFLTPSCENWL